MKLAKQIREYLSEVDRICFAWDYGSDSEEKERVATLIEFAFESSLVLAEALHTDATRSRILSLFKRAKKNLTLTAYSEQAAEVYSVWAYRLQLILHSLEIAHLNSDNKPIPEKPLAIISRIVRKFDHVERALQQRRESRCTLTVKDEYDVQDLLRSLLFLHFKDVRPEEPGPSFAGSSTRADLFLKKEKILISIKKTRVDTSQKALQEDLILEIVKYSKRDDCQAMVIVIDDRVRRLKNPDGFAYDLRHATKDFCVLVRYIR
ncbi:MAG: hypothetical protein WA491_09275 [Candidatus Acidiferrum sp.]